MPNFFDEARDWASFVRKLREQLHLTQEDFGRRVGVSKGYVSRLESGVSHPSGPLRILLSQLAVEALLKSFGH